MLHHLDETLGGIGAAVGQRIARHLPRRVGLRQHRGDVLRERAGVKRGFRDEDGGLGLDEAAGVAVW